MVAHVRVRVDRLRLRRALVRSALARMGHGPRHPAPLFLAVRTNRVAERIVRNILAISAELG